RYHRVAIYYARRRLRHSAAISELSERTLKELPPKCDLPIPQRTRSRTAVVDPAGSDRRTHRGSGRGRPQPRRAGEGRDGAPPGPRPGPPTEPTGGRLMIPVAPASQSPARRQILTAAGIDPQIIDSGVDARATDAGFTGSVGDLTTALSEAKARAVIDRIRSCPPPELTGTETVVVIAGDSLLEHAGQAIGKPGTAERTRAVWSEIAGQWTQLHTGHTV